MQFPIVIELRRSRRLTLLLGVFHVLAAGCVLAVPWPSFIRVGLLLLIGASLVRALRRSPIRNLYLCSRQRIDGLLTDGTRAPLSVLPDSAVFARMIVLRLCFGEEQRVRNLTLLSDQMSAEHFRVLRIWLRWRSQPKAADEPGSAS